MRPYARLLLYQSLLALAATSAGSFFVFYYLEDGGTLGPPLTLFLLGFAIAVVGSLALGLRPANPRLAMAAGALLFASLFPAILLLPKPLSPFPAALGFGLSIPLFFVPLNALAAGLTKDGDRAVKLGGLFLGFTAVGIVGPSLGGLLVKAGGYALAFSFGVTVLAADAALILALERGRAPIPFPFDLGRLGGRASAGLFSEGGMEGALAIAGPAALYSFVQAPEAFGLLLSAFAFAGGVATVLLARISDRDRGRRRRFLVPGATVTAVALAGISTATTLPQYAAMTSLMQMTVIIAPLFLFATAVDRFGKNHGGGVATREVLLNAGRVLGALAVLGLVAARMDPMLGFAVAAVFAAGMAAG